MPCFRRRLFDSGGGGLVVMAALVITISAGFSSATMAQDSGDAEATIAALQTEVADLTTQVAALTTPTASAPGPSGTPEPAASLLIGDALPRPPTGNPGVVDVIAVGSPVRASVFLSSARSNTGADVLLSGVARDRPGDESGALAFSGDVSRMFAPFLLPAGQVAVGDVYFGSDLPSGTHLRV